MVLRDRLVLSLAAGALLAAGPVLFGCGGDAPVFHVTGRVLASGDVDDGLAGVTVRCGGNPATALTATDGSYFLECPLPAAPDEVDGPKPAAMIWFEHPDFAPVVRTFVPADGQAYTVAPTMLKAVVHSNVSIPAGNTSVPVLLGALTLSFERDSVLDSAGAPVAGDLAFEAAGWDNSLPVELDEGSGEMVTDALYPPWPRRVLDDSAPGTWMRPIAAGWFDLGDAAVNGDVAIPFQLFSRFADAVAGRDVNEPGDASLFLVRPDLALPEKVDGAALTAVNQIATAATTDGLMTWMVPVAQHACVDVTVMKGETPANGAQVTLFEIFDGELELFCDEQIGSGSGKYCLNAVSGKQVRVQAMLDGSGGLMTKEADLLSGGNASCGGACASITINFPCEINEECDVGDTCEAGICTAPAAI